VGVFGFPERLPIAETHPFAPRTLYSVTKVEAEALVRRRAAELGVPFAIVRPTIIYGRGDTNGMLDKLAAMIRSGRYRVVGDGQNVLHHTYIDDVVRGILAAARSDAALGEDFILCGPETITLERLGQLVGEAVGRPVPRLHVPLPLARAVAAACDVLTYRGLAFSHREPPINNEKLDVMAVPISFSGEKAARLLGFRAATSYREGIAATLA
jgi:nucleoside-diphosphate-sugar epimerase